MRGDRRIFAVGLVLSVVLHAGALWAFRSGPAGVGAAPPTAQHFTMIAVRTSPEVSQVERLRPDPPRPPAPLPKSRRPPAPAAIPPEPAPVAAPAPTGPPTQAALPAQPIVPPEPPPPPTATASPHAKRLVHGRYEQSVASWVERQRVYPLAARQRRWEGTAIVRLRLAADGSLLTAQLVRDTGFALLDDAALGMVRRAAPFPRLPEEIGAGQIEILVPIQFSLLGEQGR